MNLLSKIGSIAHALNMGGSPKDAITNFAQAAGSISGLLLLIDQYYPLGSDAVKFAAFLGAVSIWIIGGASGKTCDLNRPQF
jgi:hypothetical protein